jgi:predicted transposase/invertase (TIGR01784 family)
MPKKPSKPHDEFFKASFGRRDIALEYLQQMLPAELREDLDLERLERVNGSFVSPALQEYFSDVVYRCPLKSTATEIRPCFIFEHKSKPESRPHLQLLRYMLDTWSEQLSQGYKLLTPIVPIIVYHGRQGWRQRKMSSYFGKKLPASLLPYIPQFDYVLTNVQSLSDQQILELYQGLLINTFLMMKHIWEPEYILQHPQLIFINLQEPKNQGEFIVFMLAYLLKNTELAREKVQNFVQTLPKALNPNVMSAYDLIIEDAVGEIKETLKKERLQLRAMELEAKKAKLLLKKQELELEEISLREEEYRLREKEVQNKSIELHKLEEETQAKAEEMRKREEEIQAKAEEMRKREEETQAKAEEMRKREEESQAKAEEMRKREEEAEEIRQMLNRTILNLHQLAQMSSSEIAAIVGTGLNYVETIINGKR